MSDRGERAAAVEPAEDLAQGREEDTHTQDEDEEESRYTIDHLSAVIRPVGLTMILASIAVAKIRDPNVDAALSNGLSSYLVYNEGTGDASDSTTFGQAIINAIVIVSVIAAATFVLVLCYYFRCLKLMVAYLIFASINLLGYTGGFMAYSAIQLWRIQVDWPTLVFIMYNFAIGGVISVFWQKGIPRIVTQGYLVAVSVIMAWMLTKLPEWTAWVLLVVLALYDLCAVLTPCGPLRALINLAQKRRDPIPGLLYEANVGEARDDEVRDSFVTGPAPPSTREGGTRAGTETGPTKTRSSSNPGDVATVNPSIAARSSGGGTGTGPHRVAGGGGGSGTGDGTELCAVEGTPNAQPRRLRGGGGSSTPSPAAKDLDTAPLSPSRGGGHTMVMMPGEEGDAGAEEDVVAGGDEDDADDDEEGGPDRSIKLGLGDFVFYSVLVSRAALFDVCTMAACFVSVIMGLGGTLFLLGVYKKALPALPISIFLGVAFYFLTRLVVTPMIVELSLAGAGL